MRTLTQAEREYIEAEVAMFIKLAIINPIVNHECNARLPTIFDLVPGPGRIQ
jgi:hypothetical protein